MVRHFCDRCGRQFERIGTEKYMSGKYSYIAVKDIKKNREERLALCGECFDTLMTWLKNGGEENGKN